MSQLDLLLSIALGVGLAAATGLRVFLPLLVAAIAAHTGYIDLSENFAWIGTTPALVMLGVAAIIEVLAYYVPGVDNLLDTLAAPAALVAGTVVAAAVMGDVPPLIKWTTAVIAGGGAAGLTQAATSLLRAKSTIATGGLGNSVIATGELLGSAGVAVLALFAPLLALGLAVLFCWFVVRVARKLLRRPNASSTRTGADA